MLQWFIHYILTKCFFSCSICRAIVWWLTTHCKIRHNQISISVIIISKHFHLLCHLFICKREYSQFFTNMSSAVCMKHPSGGEGIPSLISQPSYCPFVFCGTTTPNKYFVVKGSRLCERACIYYHGAVKQDVARPVTEVNTAKPMNGKAMLSRVKYYWMAYFPRQSVF